MAEKRMFAKTVVESGAFYRMSAKAQCLYLHLCMNADDDGLLNNALVICRSLNFNKNILQELLDKRFILDCGDDVMCIKHWKMSNTIAKDRYKPSVYQDALQKLIVKDNKSYTDCIQNDDKKTMYTECIQDVYTDKNRLDKSKNRLDKNSIDDDINTINARMLEAGIDKDIIHEAVWYYTHLDCPRTKDFYLKILDVLQNDGIYNKTGYLTEVLNEQKRKTQVS